MTTAPFPLTWLYVPGDRPHVVAKALACGADVVVIDLEDAVAPDRKDCARAAIHPRQLPIIERAYLPTQAELEHAEKILKAATTEQGAQALPDGSFIDAAVVATARRTLSLSTRR